MIDYGEGYDDEEVLKEYLKLKNSQELLMAGLTKDEAMQAQQLHAALQFQQHQQQQHQDFLMSQMKKEGDPEKEQASIVQHQFMMNAAAK